MKKVCIVTAVATMFILGCTPYGVSRKNSSQKEEPKDTSDLPVTRYEPSGPVHLTFLDTLNKGNELVLNDSDFEKTPPVTSATLAQVESSIRYKIQLFASSQIETIREQKREMENRISLPLSISFESPYYKLLAGSFTQRAEAEQQLKKLQKLGYTDAWIVSSKTANN